MNTKVPSLSLALSLRCVQFIFYFRHFFLLFVLSHTAMWHTFFPKYFNTDSSLWAVDSDIYFFVQKNLTNTFTQFKKIIHNDLLLCSFKRKIQLCENTRRHNRFRRLIIESIRLQLFCFSCSFEFLTMNSKKLRGENEHVQWSYGNKHV